MKVIITGATGFVATEVVRQALKDSRITSVVALARKPVEINDRGLDTSKLKSVTIEDYTVYPDSVRKEFAGANACIWTVAITPTKSRSMDCAEVKKVCQDSVLKGAAAMYESGVSKPFRFLYMSGSTIPRDPDAKAAFGNYSRIRCETENQILAWGASHKGEVDVTVAKPGLIYTGALRTVIASVCWLTGLSPTISQQEVAAAMLQQATDGFEKDPLTNEDLMRLGQAALAQQKP